MKRKDDEPERPVVVPLRAAEPEDDEVEDAAAAYWREYDDAVRDAERVLAAALVRRAEANNHRDWQGAEVDLYRAAGLDPESGAPWYHLAVNERDHAEALGFINEALARDTSEASYWACRADVHEQLGELERALADLDRAVQLDKDDDSVVWLIMRAKLNDRLGRWDEARRDYARAVERKPDRAYLLSARAVVLARSGDLVGARRELDAVIAAHPELIVAVREKALLCQRMGDGDEALRAIDRVIAALADDPDMKSPFDHYIRGAILASRGEWARALAAFDAANAKEASSHIDIRRAQCLLALGRVRAALAACDGAVRDEPYNEGFFHWRSRVRASAGDLRGAMADARRAIERAPEDARFVAEKASLHARTGRRALARSEARRALRMLRKPQPAPRLYHALLEEYEARGLDLGYAPPVSRAELERLARL